MLSVWLLTIGQWQQEILDIVKDPAVLWKYNFAGFGDFGLDWWSWRDVWYAWDWIVTMFGYVMCLILGSVLTEKKKLGDNV